MHEIKSVHEVIEVTAPNQQVEMYTTTKLPPTGDSSVSASQTTFAGLVVIASLIAIMLAIKRHGGVAHE